MIYIIAKQVENFTFLVMKFRPLPRFSSHFYQIIINHLNILTSIGQKDIHLLTTLGKSSTGRYKTVFWPTENWVYYGQTVNDPFKTSMVHGENVMLINMRLTFLVTARKPYERQNIFLALFSSPVQSTGRAIVVTLASALPLPLPLPLPFPSRHF